MDTLILSVGSLAVGGVTGTATAVWGAPLLDRLNGRLLACYGPLFESVGTSAALLPVMLRWWRASTATAFLVFWFWIDMPPVAVFMAFVTNRAGPILVEWWITHRRKLISEQAVTAARNLAGQVRVGMAINEALAEVARDTPAPFGDILRRTVRRLEAGESVRDVLTDLRARIRVDAVAIMSIAILVATEKGGKLGDVLTRISSTLEEAQRVARKRDTDTAAGRLMVLIMAVFPFAFVTIFSIMDPQLMQALFDTLAGQGVLAIVGVLVYLSTRWASRILAKVE